MPIILEFTDEQLKELEKRKGTDKPISDIVLQAIFARNSKNKSHEKEKNINEKKDNEG